MATARIDIETRINLTSLENAPGLTDGHFGRRDVSGSADRRACIFDLARRHASCIRHVPGGTALFAEGETSDNLFVVLNGWLLQQRILEDGRRQILDFALPGSVLGYRCRPDVPFTFSAEAVTNCEVAFIPLDLLRRLLRNGVESAVILLETANEALLGAFDTITDIGRRTAREAVAHFLLRMERRIRQNAKPSMDGTIPFPLCQEHIGDALGLTAVHVCRTLGKLRKSGLVELKRNRLCIMDMEALEEEAGVYRFNDRDMPLAS